MQPVAVLGLGHVGLPLVVEFGNPLPHCHRTLRIVKPRMHRCSSIKATNAEVFAHDPEGDLPEALYENGVTLSTSSDLPRADVIVAALAHVQHGKET